jgi:hypothetical protein
VKSLPRAPRLWLAFLLCSIGILGAILAEPVGPSSGKSPADQCWDGLGSCNRRCTTKFRRGSDYYARQDCYGSCEDKYSSCMSKTAAVKTQTGSGKTSTTGTANKTGAITSPTATPTAPPNKTNRNRAHS